MQKPFLRNGGRCFTAYLPELAALADSPTETQSPVAVLEDGAPLGPAHALHREIREMGGGRFSHWLSYLFFSTSDDTDPNTNGRTYDLVVDNEALGIAKDEVKAYHEAGKCIANLLFYLTDADIYPSSLKDASVLEIGPGNLGVPTMLASMGAAVTIVEPRPILWDAKFHPTYLNRSIELIEQKLKVDLPRTGIDTMIGSNGSDMPGIRVLNTSAEAMTDRIEPDTFDYVFSNSVVEHFDDFECAIENLALLSKRGAVHRHGVDYRDHGDFKFPLEFLLEDDEKFDPRMGTQINIRGNRARASQVEAAFERNRLYIESKKVMNWTTDAEATAFRSDVESRGRSAQFKDCSDIDLRTLSADYTLVKF